MRCESNRRTPRAGAAAAGAAGPLRVLVLYRPLPGAKVVSLSRRRAPASTWLEMPRRSRPRQAPLVSVLVWLCFHLLCASPTPAQGFRAYVTLGRKQNVWWRGAREDTDSPMIPNSPGAPVLNLGQRTGIVAAFGGECARVCVPDGEQRCPRTCEGLPSPNGTPFTVVWHSDLVEEKMWLDELAQNTADPTDVVLITKYCSANGGCSSVVPDGGWSLGFEAGDHDGRAYAPLLRLGFRIYFFEYAPVRASCRFRLFSRGPTVAAQSCCVSGHGVDAQQFD
eukprot:SAG31_NODE_1849_length_7088_cov_2.647446_10_plen_280_part_00